MEIKTVKEKLQQVADYTVLPEYAEALETAVRMIDRVAELEAELRDERYRHDRYADYSVERDGMIDQLKDDLRNSGRNDPCDYCKHSYEPVPCEDADYICNECTHEGCVCHACREWDKWEWRGMPEAKVVEIDQVKKEG